MFTYMHNMGCIFSDNVFFSDLILAIKILFFLEFFLQPEHTLSQTIVREKWFILFQCFTRILTIVGLENTLGLYLFYTINLTFASGLSHGFKTLFFSVSFFFFSSILVNS